MPKLQGRIYLGIDPGKNGGLAIVGAREDATKMPGTERDLWDCFARLAEDTGLHPHAVIEKVGGYIRGSQGNIGSAMFNFGVGYGMLKMALVAAHIPFEEVTPRTWQKSVGISPKRKAESKQQFKNRIKGIAQRLFPNLQVTLATADALLIAEYCRRRVER